MRLSKLGTCLPCIVGIGEMLKSEFDTREPEKLGASCAIYMFGNAMNTRIKYINTLFRKKHRHNQAIFAHGGPTSFQRLSAPPTSGNGIRFALFVVPG